MARNVLAYPAFCYCANGQSPDKGIQLIGIYYSPVLYPEAGANYAHLKYEVEIPVESGIRIVGASKDDLEIIDDCHSNVIQTFKFDKAKPILRYILADFSEAKVGKHRLKFRAKGKMLSISAAERMPFEQTEDSEYLPDRSDWDLERDIFVVDTVFNFENNKFSVEVPEGTLTVQILSTSVWTDDEDWYKKTLLVNHPEGFLITPLFSVINPSYQLESELGQGNMPEELYLEFIRHGYELGNELNIHEREEHWWEISDGSSSYVAEFACDSKKKTFVNVYSAVIRLSPLVFPDAMIATMIPREPFSGIHAPLPFQDPAWKVPVAIIAAIVFGAIAIYSALKAGEDITIIFPIYAGDDDEPTYYRSDWTAAPCEVDENGMVCTKINVEGNTTNTAAWVGAATLSGVASSIAIALAQGAAIGGMSEPIDPFREGEAHTIPNSDEMTIKEIVELKFNYSEESLHPNDPFGIQLDWSFQRVTSDGVSERVYPYTPETWETRPIVTADLSAQLNGDIQEMVEIYLAGQMQSIPLFREQSDVIISTYLRSLITNEAVTGNDAYVTATILGPSDSHIKAILIDESQTGEFANSISIDEGMHLPLFALRNDSSYQVSLDQGIFSSELRKEFENQGIVFTSPVVIVREPMEYQGWRLDSDKETYWLRLDGNPEKLYVYSAYSIYRVHILAQSVNHAKFDDEPLEAAAHIGGVVMNSIIDRDDNADCAIVVHATFGVTKGNLYKTGNAEKEKNAT